MNAELKRKILNEFPKVKDSTEFDSKQMPLMVFLGDSEEYIDEIRRLYYALKFIDSLKESSLKHSE